MTSTNPRSTKQNKVRDPLARGLQLLRWAVQTERREIGVREAASALQIAPSTAHQLMTSLVHEGFLRRQENGGGYGLGHELMMLAHKAAQRLPIRDIALPHMRSLVAECNEATFLNVYDRNRQEFFAVASVDADHELRYVIEMYKWKPVHLSSAGWAIMAHLSEDERREIINRTKLAPMTVNSVTNADELEAALAEVRAKGYAITRGQRILGAIGMCAPIFGPDGGVIGGIGITFPEQRWQPDTEARLACPLMACAKAVSEELAAR
jgi:DNA-binding IclR family transcriptional regulator